MRTTAKNAYGRPVPNAHASSTARGPLAAFIYLGVLAGLLMIQAALGASQDELARSLLAPGDRTVFGVLRTVFVVVVSLRLFAIARQSTNATRGNEEQSKRALWLFDYGCATLVLAYALNTQLDLQTHLTNAAKQHALDNGWYENRRQVQLIFVAALGAAGIAASAVGAWVWRRLPKRRRLYFLGLFALYGYALFRAAAFHHIQGVSDFGPLVVGFAELTALSPFCFTFAPHASKQGKAAERDLGSPA